MVATLKLDLGIKIQKNGCNSEVGPGFPLGLREDGGLVLWISTPVRYGVPVGGDGQCMHKFVRPTWILWSLVHPGKTFLKQHFFRGWEWDTLGKPGKTNLNILGTCDNKGSLCDTESGGRHTPKSTRQWKNSARIRLAAQRSKPVKKKIKWAAQRPQPWCLMLIKLDSSLGRSHFVPDGVDQCHVGCLQRGGQLRPACCRVTPVKNQNKHMGNASLTQQRPDGKWENLSKETTWGCGIPQSAKVLCTTRYSAGGKMTNRWMGMGVLDGDGCPVRG